MAEFNLCLIKGCDNRKLAKGLCNAHYKILKKYGSLEIPERKVRQVRVDGNIAYVPLTRGYEAIIDADDAHLVSFTNWHAFVSGGNVYAKTNLRNDHQPWQKPLMHRTIMSAPDGSAVDHINGNGLDNRRSNLRLVTSSQNAMNQSLRSDNTTGYKGVCEYKSRGQWVASITRNGSTEFLGYFDCPKKAHAAYCEASKRLHGEFGRTE